MLGCDSLGYVTQHPLASAEGSSCYGREIQLLLYLHFGWEFERSRLSHELSLELMMDKFWNHRPPSHFLRFEAIFLQTARSICILHS